MLAHSSPWWLGKGRSACPHTLQRRGCRRALEQYVGCVHAAISNAWGSLATFTFVSPSSWSKQKVTSGRWKSPSNGSLASAYKAPAIGIGLSSSQENLPFLKIADYWRFFLFSWTPPSPSFSLLAPLEGPGNSVAFRWFLLEFLWWWPDVANAVTPNDSTKKTVGISEDPDSWRPWTWALISSVHDLWAFPIQHALPSAP